MTRSQVRKAGVALAETTDPEEVLRANGKELRSTMAPKNESMQKQRKAESRAEKLAREKGVRITEGRE